MFKRVKLSYLSSFYTNYTTRVAIDPNIRESFEAKEYKPRKHPGTARIKIASIPPDIQEAIKVIFEDTGAKSLYQDSIKLNNYLRSRHLPPEQGDIDKKAAAIYDKVSKGFKHLQNESINQEIFEKENKRMEVKIFNALKRNVYRWANIDYDKPTSLQYLMIRSAAEYAVLIRILDEINRINPEYRPRSFFDFGSGVGTGTWAVNHFWRKDIYEYYCVDISSNMHDLARLILCNGKDNVTMPIKGYFQRQFLPASTDLKYSIVLSAFTLFELPDMKTRLETVQRLWNKTEDYLIIVEQGTSAGFTVINEAREFVLNLKDSHKGYAFSPCPNDNVCPRYLEQKTPCNFLMKYESLPFPSKMEISAELFSYVILKKGNRPPDDPQWPRVVRAPIVRSGHTVCRLCTAQGELKEVIFSKSKYDKTTYHCARSCNWGDLLPVK